jgi:bacillithiol system protein YtxJ
MNWNQLTEASQIAQIKEESKQHPVLIIKHSTTCSISNTALSRLERNYKPELVGKLKPYYLDLLSFRSVSNAVAEAFSVEHQSPQILLIKNGQCIYDESHFGISFNGILAKISE